MVTKALQRESLDLSDVRTLFDAMIVKYPETEVMKENSVWSRKLSHDADIVQNPCFEGG